MPLRLDIKRKLSARSDRVKSVDLHPTEPWMVASLYNGSVCVWNHETQTIVKTFEVCDLPVRTSKFVARKHWVIAGADDMQIRVFNYNTLERVHVFEAHSDYIRCIAVHPTQPYILTSSDDMLIKLWDWEKKWSCSQVFEGHSHYVMQMVINPKDNNQFASASLDRTIKVWQLGSSSPNFTLEGHEKGVNCIDYYSGGDKPYLISGADDRMVKIWDYQNKTCVQTLEGHAQNVSCVSFHPELPIILTGSEDGTVRIWHASTYRLESTLNYGMERVWCVCSLRSSNSVALGYDEGSIIIKLGREEPAMSMDSNGKIIWARHSEVQQANLKAMGDAEMKDGERLPLAVKDMGSCEIYPQTIQHNPNGRFVVVCGDGEYIIYTAMALRNKSFGSAQEFVWAHDSSEYATRESSNMVKLFKNFKEKKSFRPDFGAEGVYGGYLLGVRSSNGLAFYDWENTQLVRRIEIQPKHIFWSDSGELVCIATDESFFVLKYLSEKVAAAQESNEGVTEDGIEDAFEVLGEIQEIVKTGLWVGDCFIYTSSVNRLNYFVGGEIVTIAHLDRTMYLLGYIPKDDRLYLGDKELNIVSYSLLVSVLEYQTAVMRRDFGMADKVLPTIPKEQRTRVAHFLEKQGFKQQALAVSTDPEHRFELALQLGELKTAYQLATESESEHKWKQLAELATAKCQFRLAQECLHHAQDYGGLLLLATASGNASMVRKLSECAERDGKNNVAFLTYFLQGRLNNCLELLIRTNRLPEAAFLARTYLPSQVSRVVKLWRESLSKVNQKAAESLADPSEYENLFPGLKEAYVAEQYLRETAKTQAATDYPLVSPNEERAVLEESRGYEPKGIPIATEEAPETGEGATAVMAAVAAAEGPVVTEVDVPPVVLEAEASVVTEAGAPLVNEAEVPVASEAEAPIVVEAVTPVLTEAEGSFLAEEAVTEAESPVVVEAEAPVAVEVDAPVVREEDTPVVTEAEASVATEEDTPVVVEAEAPVLTEVEALVATEVDAPVVTEAEVDAPVVTEAEVDAPVVMEAEALVATEEDTPVVTEAEAPVATEVVSPVVMEEEVPVITEEEVPVITEAETPLMEVMEEDTPVVVAAESPESSAVTEVEVPVISEVQSPNLPEEEESIPVEAQTLVVEEAPKNVEEGALFPVEVESPNIPEMEAPLIPEMETPLIQEMEAPLIQEMEAPLILEMGAPLIQEVEAPIIQEVEAPLIQEVEDPIIPEVDDSLSVDDLVTTEPEASIDTLMDAPIPALVPLEPALVLPETAAFQLSPTAVQESPVGTIPAPAAEGSAAQLKDEALFDLDDELDEFDLEDIDTSDVNLDDDFLDI
ncbi:coatomer subunit beta'-like [Conger conger]|uniref:coatomer subunit beta'-like n=1 Tax=Conger conger TaxID=82655 RepID=UPI002A59C33C|nr:coatomer subunit beta'-like [Conger conger]